MRKRIHILSIDGGGIRGVVPSLFLRRLENDLGKPTCRIFDYIVGTSTGAILALGLTKPRDGSRSGLGENPPTRLPTWSISTSKMALRFSDESVE